VVADLARRGFDVRSLRQIEGDQWEMQREVTIGTGWGEVKKETLPFSVRATHRRAALPAFREGKGEYPYLRIHGGLQ